MKASILRSLLAATLMTSAACGQPEALKGEIKWTVPLENIPHAREVLGLKAKEAEHREEWFFDTAGQELRKTHHLVLRARQDEEGTDSTVKLRVPDAAGSGGAGSQQGKVEIDWGETVQSLSVSEDAKEPAIPALAKVMDGTAAVKDLFPTEAQQKLLAPALAGLDWKQVKRYGPVQAQVWKNKKDKPAKVHLPGYEKEKVTAELWHLEKGGQSRDILEISIKTEGTREQIGKQAEAFFAAARKHLLGDTSKTGVVLDFFAPGR